MIRIIMIIKIIIMTKIIIIMIKIIIIMIKIIAIITIITVIATLYWLNLPWLIGGAKQDAILPVEPNRQPPIVPF